MAFAILVAAEYIELYFTERVFRTRNTPLYQPVEECLKVRQNEGFFEPIQPRQRSPAILR